MRSIINEGVRESTEHAPVGISDFDGTSRAGALRELLDKDALERVPTHAFWGKQAHRISARQMMAQTANAARLWERLHPGKPMHFMETRGTTWSLRLRMWAKQLGFGILVLWCSHAEADERAQRAADILRNMQSSANFATRPAPLPDGPTVVIIGSTPSASSWMEDWYVRQNHRSLERYRGVRFYDRAAHLRDARRAR